MNLSNYFIHPHVLESKKISLEEYANALRSFVVSREFTHEIDNIITERIFSEVIEYMNFNHQGDISSFADYSANNKTGVRVLLQMQAEFRRISSETETPETHTDGFTDRYFELIKILFKCFHDGKIDSYAMQSDMLKILVDTDLSSFKKEFFPKNFGGYIAFEKGLINYEGDGVPYNLLGAYCGVVVKDDITYLQCIILNLDNDGNLSFGKVKGSLEEILEAYSTAESDSHTKSLLKSLLLSIMYVHTGERDVRVLKSALQIPPSQRKRFKKKEPENYEENYSEDIYDDVFLVGFSWKKDPLYTKEYWGVRAFFREQAYGPGMSLRKLKWIAPHQAHRRKPLAGNPVDDYEFYFDDNF